MTRTSLQTHLPLRGNHCGKGLVLTTLALLSLGVVMVHSAVASVAQPGPWYARVDLRHTAFAIVAAVVLATLWQVDYRRLAAGEKSPRIAGAILALGIICGVLVFVPGIGFAKGGYYRWIRIGPARYSIGFQPSELIKLGLVVFLSAWLSRESVNPRSFKKAFLPAMGIVGLCAALVVTQDFGTAAIIGISACVTLLLAGVPWYYLASFVPVVAGVFYAFVVRSPHRWARIAAMLDPWSLDNPSAYQARQSLLAILTGGWTGKGIGRGTLKMGFLPEDSTDFIFSVFCEEWGFIGAMLLMGLVMVWIYLARRAARQAGEGFGALLAGSLGFLIAFQAVMHIAVDVVVLPPTGMSMPFISAGGTSLLLMSAATAMIVSVTAHRGRLDQDGL